MSEDEVESFEITDYDLDNEFNINRPKRKLSKKQQMLGEFVFFTYSGSQIQSTPPVANNLIVVMFVGIWADDSDDEVTARPSFANYHKGPKNYTAPVNFVAGGIQQAGQPKPQENEGDEDDDKSQDDSDIANTSRCFNTYTVFASGFVTNLIILPALKVNLRAI